MDDDRADDVIAGFVLEDLIGSGGIADVYAARHVSRTGRFAVKIARPPVDARMAKRFEREASIIRALDNPYVVPGVACGSHDGAPYVVMPLVQGRTLHDLVARDGALPVQRASAIAHGIAAGLAAAHDKLLVHRDLKPGNVIIAEEPRDHPRILDFGLARAYDGNEMRTRLTMGLSGTPSYMSPEHIQGEEVGPPADLYAFGAIVCFMLTGHPPYRGKSIDEKLRAHLTERPPDLSRHGQLGDLAMRCLSKDAADRPASAHEIVETLAADARTAVEHNLATRVELAGDTKITLDPSASEVVVAPRSRAGVVAALLVGVVLVSASATAVFLRDDETPSVAPAPPPPTPVVETPVVSPKVVAIPGDAPPPPPAVTPPPAPPPPPVKRKIVRRRRPTTKTPPPPPPPVRTKTIDERLDAVRRALKRVPASALGGLETEYLEVRELASRRSADDAGLLRRVSALEKKTREALK